MSLPVWPVRACRAKRSVRRARQEPSGQSPFRRPAPQPKLPLVISDFYFDLPRVCVSECIPQCLACNPIDVVPNWSEIPRGVPSTCTQSPQHYARQRRGGNGRDSTEAHGQLKAVRIPTQHTHGAIRRDQAPGSEPSGLVRGGQSESTPDCESELRAIVARTGESTVAAWINEPAGCHFLFDQHGLLQAHRVAETQADREACGTPSTSRMASTKSLSSGKTTPRIRCTTTRRQRTKRSSIRTMNRWNRKELMGKPFCSGAKLTCGTRATSRIPFASSMRCWRARRRSATTRGGSEVNKLKPVDSEPVG